MGKRRPEIDLWDLFIDGRAGEIIFGDTDVRTLRRIVGVRSQGYEGRLPYSSWILEAEDTECFFQGFPPRLWGLKIRPDRLTVSDEASELLSEEGKPSESWIGLSRISLKGQAFSAFATIHALFRNFPEAEKLKMRSSFDKQLDFYLSRQGRSLIFGYRAETRRIADGVFDFDYFLYGVWLHDFDVDAELSKTLPEGSGDRFTEIARIANAGKVS